MTSTIAPTVSHVVTLHKPAQRTLRDKVLFANVESLLNSVNTRAKMVRGWTVAPVLTEDKPWVQSNSTDEAYSYDYTVELAVTFTGKGTPEPHEFDAIVRTIATRCTQPSFGRWNVTKVDGATWTADTPADNDEQTDDALGYAPVEIPEDFYSYFDHLYGLDAQIGRVLRAMEAGILSDWDNRYHCALVGPPGCGKSDVCQSIKRALGDDAVMEFDATATTASGAIKELSEREILPRVILIEEIEKAPEQAMTFLLGVLDLRSQIRKTTARATIVRDTKMFAIATVNDVPLFEKLQAGALASRFSNVIGFRRPSRDLLAKILKREIEKVNGDLAWIDPTLDYCEAADITDPRKVTAICLCGREMLLDGSYQAMLNDTEDARYVGTKGA